MPFVPDTDVNYQAYKTQLAKYTGNEADEFKDNFIQYLMLEITSSAVPAISTAVNNAHASMKGHKRNF